MVKPSGGGAFQLQMGAQEKKVRSSTFESRFTAELPAHLRDDNRPRQVPGACFSRVRPAGASRPVMIAWSGELAEALGLDPAWAWHKRGCSKLSCSS